LGEELHAEMPPRMPEKILRCRRQTRPDTPGDNWHSVAVCSDGSYNVDKGLISSFPVRVSGGKWEIVQGLPINNFSREKIDASVAELKEEKSLVSDLI
jgi:malate dehydrogenase